MEKIRLLLGSIFALTLSIMANANKVAQQNFTHNKTVSLAWCLQTEIKDTFILRLLIVTFIMIASGSSQAEGIIEDQRINAIDEPLIVAEKFTFESEILGNKRTFYVHLPENYHNSNDSYPVLYIADGDRKMLRIASVTHELSYFAKRIPPMIIVGIANDGTRKENLSLLPSSIQFLTFITDELKPYINKQYRTNNENLLLGSSAGGQFAIRALLEKPDEFDAFFAISPSLFYNNYHLVKKAQEIALSGQERDKTLYISLGNEGVYMGADELALNLAKYPIAKLTWSFTKVEEESHDSISMKQAYNALQDYYSSWAAPHFKNIRDFENKGGLEALSAKYNDAIPKGIPFKILNSIADLYFYANHFQQGIELALLNVEKNPTLSLARQYVGEYYELTKNIDQAIKYYQQALDIESKNKNEAKIKRYQNIIEKLTLKQIN